MAATDITYTVTPWQDFPNTSTAIIAARLNNIENGIVSSIGQGNAARRETAARLPILSAAPDPTVFPAYLDTSTVPPAIKGWNGTAWVVLGGGSSGGGTGGLTVVDNGDGTATQSGSSVVDNGDGTYSMNDPGVTDNGDGTYQAAA